MELYLRRKDEANVYFQQNEIKKARQLYCNILSDIADGDEHLQNMDMKSFEMSIRNNILACHVKCGDFDEAIMLASGCLHIDPGNVKALYRRAISYQHKNQIDLARLDCEAIIHIEPSNVQAQILMDLLTAAAHSTDTLLQPDKNQPATVSEEKRTEYAFMNPQWSTMDDTSPIKVILSTPLSTEQRHKTNSMSALLKQTRQQKLKTASVQTGATSSEMVVGVMNGLKETESDNIKSLKKTLQSTSVVTESVKQKNKATKLRSKIAKESTLKSKRDRKSVV